MISGSDERLKKGGGERATHRFFVTIRAPGTMARGVSDLEEEPTSVQVVSFRCKLRAKQITRRCFANSTHWVSSISTSRFSSNFIDLFRNDSTLGTESEGGEDLSSLVQSEEREFGETKELEEKGRTRPTQEPFELAPPPFLLLLLPWQTSDPSPLRPLEQRHIPPPIPTLS